MSLPVSGEKSDNGKKRAILTISTLIEFPQWEHETGPNNSNSYSEFFANIFSIFVRLWLQFEWDVKGPGKEGSLTSFKKLGSLIFSEEFVNKYGKWEIFVLNFYVGFEIFEFEQLKITNYQLI